MLDSPENTAGSLLPAIGHHRKQVEVRLSKELITLLSEQLYQSPSKAVEELVVNSFDADATSCHVMVPIASAGTDTGRLPVITVYDDGAGMNADEMTDLWAVGSSDKRTERIERLRKRRQIGKFGIGKLATYALANRITYVSSAGSGEIIGVSLSYSAFSSEPLGPDEPVQLDLRVLTIEELLALPNILQAFEASGIDAHSSLTASRSWTLVILEELKERSARLSPGRLRWVLSTAMPISTNFKLFLNGEEVESSKSKYELYEDFAVAELPQSRIENLKAKTKRNWTIESRPLPSHLQPATLDGHPDAQEPAYGMALVSEGLFDQGIFGRTIVAKKTIYTGKSSDLTRSHGFFVRVRGRLVNDDDPLFGVVPHEYRVFNRFRADIEADDLDEDITAPREGLNVSERRAVMIDVLTEVFNEARVRSDKKIDDDRKKNNQKREEDRNYVDPRNVERPTADVLLRDDTDDEEDGSDADEEWFYLGFPPVDEREKVATELYEQQSTRETYEYQLESLGRNARMVRFVPGERKFIINEDHDVVIAFYSDPRARDLLYDMATAEALLEIYLREANVPAHIVGEVLERRDVLLRSLAQEHIVSPKSIATNLRDAVASERDLEIALIVAARALGFVAKHMSGSTNPDGLARLRDYPQGERKITLEAKSSANVPSLGAIDFAGLAQHVRDTESQGCLLIAPDYPGKTRADDAAAAKRARDFHISCWTVEQLAQVVGAMESHHITARQILDIVLNAFTPSDVAKVVEQLLSGPTSPPRELAQGVVAALESLELYGPDDMIRSLDMIGVELKRAGISAPVFEVRNATRALAAASQGALQVLDEDRFRLDTSVEELARRVSPLLGNEASPRRASTFRSEGMRPDVS